jgi:hypothetical protein
MVTWGNAIEIAVLLPMEAAKRDNLPPELWVHRHVAQVWLLCWWRQASEILPPSSTERQAHHTNQAAGLFGWQQRGICRKAQHNTCIV